MKISKIATLTGLAATQGIRNVSALPLINSTAPSPRWVPGTNIDSPAFAPVNQTLSPSNTGTIWADYLRQPAVPSGSCNYAYAPTMQFDNELGTIWQRAGVVSTPDVEQGGVGDCSYGAALISLMTSGYADLVKNRIALAPNAPAPYFDVTFHDAVAQTDVVIHVDDQLPASVAAACFPWGSYQPTIDPAVGDLVLFVPYIEKALAKLFDARPYLKGNNAAGYSSLVGVAASTVLSVMSGFQTRSQVRPGPGFDSNYAGNILACVDSALPCVFATPQISDLPNLGLWNAATQTATIASGTVQNLDGTTLQITPTGATPFYLVADHAYAVVRDAGAAPSLEYVTLRNPWGNNPTGVGSYGDPQLRIDRTFLWQVMQGYTYAQP